MLVYAFETRTTLPASMLKHKPNGSKCLQSIWTKWNYQNTLRKNAISTSFALKKQMENYDTWINFNGAENVLFVYSLDLKLQGEGDFLVINCSRWEREGKI